MNCLTDGVLISDIPTLNSVNSLRQMHQGPFYLAFSRPLSEPSE